MSELVRIEELDDPRLEPYRNLKDRDLARSGDRFIAESEQVVRRLITSDIGIDSILLAEQRIEKMRDVLPPNVPVYVLSAVAIEQIIGFRFHSGALACGIRPLSVSLDELIPTLPPVATLMFLPDTNNTENLGTLLRIAAAFGVDGLLLGPQCCDPFYRQAVRVSMGTVFSLRLVRVAHTLAALQTLQAAGFDCVATTLNATAQPLTASRRRDRTVLLFGNESAGLSDEIIARCDRQITIPMDLGTDSLNVAIAAGIVMHHFTRMLITP